MQNTLYDLVSEHIIREIWDKEAGEHTKQWGSVHAQHKADLYNQFCALAARHISKLKSAENPIEMLRANIQFFIFTYFPIVPIK